MLIAVDHGNKQIKTISHTFVSGLSVSATPPAVGSNYLRYDGRYYTISNERIPYMRDKTADDRFFILTLFAIALELLDAPSPAYTPDEIVDVQLAIGLPPAHHGSQYLRFEQYFVRGELISFEFRGKPFFINIDRAVCYPQAYAAVMSRFNDIRALPKAYIIDIGGFTADYLLLKAGQPEPSVCDSLENGVIHLYNRIRSKANAEFDMLLEESDIDALLRDEAPAANTALSHLVCIEAQAFVTDLLNKLRERGVDLRTGQAVFTGGGAVLLRPQIEASGKAGNAIYIHQIAANAQGYQLLYSVSG